MFNRYFQDELANIKELGTDFSKAYPALAPMLKSSSSDPDVERLLEGVAFLTALLRQKLDDEFPEIIHEMIRLIWPHYLRPIPSSTILAFKPKPTLKQPITLQPGIHVASIPVEGTSCIFQTCFEVQVNPLTILEARFQERSGHNPVIQVVLELKGMKLEEWRPDKLRFFISGEYSSAADLFLLLKNHLRQILIRDLGGKRQTVLSPNHLKSVGFSPDEGVIPFPTQSFPGYRILQEYFILPEKFLFLDLTGWEQWTNRGEDGRFEILFELSGIPFRPARFKKDTFVLSATPAINIFPHEADPIRLDHRKTEYLIRPSTVQPRHYQVYSVEKVVGYTHGTAEERQYAPFELFTPASESVPVYHITLRKSPVRSDTSFYLSVAYPAELSAPHAETISIELLCTNGFLPENLRIGDISIPTSTTPEFVDFENLTVPTATLLPPLGTNLLWRLLSHLSLNYVSLESADNLKALLDLYVFEEGRDQTFVSANRKRIEGIVALEAKAVDRLLAGILMRGRQITVSARQDNYAGPGDMYLFGCVLDAFLGGYASINTFMTFVMKETLKGEIYRWPSRLGDQHLI
jgi:type VI secretion system protein ImpG